jgi:hypothetical protein
VAGVVAVEAIPAECLDNPGGYEWNLDGSELPERSRPLCQQRRHETDPIVPATRNGNDRKPSVVISIQASSPANRICINAAGDPAGDGNTTT